MSKLTSSPGWYQPDGSPVSLVQSSEGIVRECTLREARTMGLLPSVGRILRTLTDEGRTLSRLRLAAAFGAAHPALTPHEVVALAEGGAVPSQVFGRAWHRMAHSQVREFVPGLNAGRLPALEEPSLAPWRERLLGWLTANCGDNPLALQVAASARLGYGTTVDLVMWHNKFGPCLVDYVTSAGPPVLCWSRRWRSCVRLAAASDAMATTSIPLACLTLVVDSTCPSSLEVRHWTEEEFERALTIFDGAYIVWTAIAGMTSPEAETTPAP